MFSIPTLAIVVVIAIVLATQIFKILNEYERGVVFTFGRFTGVKGPGIIILIPLVQRMVKVDLRVIVLDVPTQDVISRDNVSVKVNAVIYFRIVEPDKAIIQVANPFEATSQLAQTTLRSVLGQHELDAMLSQRDKLNVDIQRILDAATDAWGIKVDQRRDQARRPQRVDDPRHGEAGRGRAHAARQDHPRRGREPGRADAGRGGASARRGAEGAAAALPADARRHLEREEHDDRVPAAARPDQAVPRTDR